MGLDAEGGFMVSKEIKSIKRVPFIIRCSTCLNILLKRRADILWKTQIAT